jgi:hypothetical protein
MANVYAVKTGNWSDTTVWNTGALPTSADDVFSNNFTVTIDIDVSVKSIREYGAYNGGIFTITSSRTVSSTDGFFIGTNQGFLIALATGRVVNLIGNIVTGTGGNGRGVYIYGTGGTVNVTGNITSNNHTGILLGEGNAVNVTLNVTGNVYGSAGSYGFGIDFNNSTSFVYITGNLYSGLSSNGQGCAVGLPSGSAIFDHVGACYPANGNPAFYGASGGTTVTLSGPFYTSVNGTHSIFAPTWKWRSGVVPTFYQVRTSDLTTIRSLYTADYVGGNPSVSNVRSGTVYGPANELTGTCAVPAAGSVALGVPVDATTGTAVLTIDAVKQGCSKAVVPALIALG